MKVSNQQLCGLDSSPEYKPGKRSRTGLLGDWNLSTAEGDVTPYTNSDLQFYSGRTDKGYELESLHVQALAHQDHVSVSKCTPQPFHMRSSCCPRSPYSNLLVSLWSKGRIRGIKRISSAWVWSGGNHALTQHPLQCPSLLHDDSINR